MHMFLLWNYFFHFSFLVLRQELIYLCLVTFFKGRVMFALLFKNTTPLALVP